MDRLDTELTLPTDLVLRPVSDADLDFLERVYASTRSEELAQTDWDDAQKSAFIGFQFRAQHQHYSTHYHGAQFFLIEHQHTAVGRLYLHARKDDLRIVDIALLPDARGQGIGAELLAALMAHATALGQGISIHVEQMNPAMHWYQRLGFQKIDEHGVYLLMQWRPDAAETVAGQADAH